MQPIVYVVDDDSGIRETLSSLLRSVGLRMQGFASTAEFLAWPRTDEPSCLVLDVRLPGLGGMEFQRQLNANHDPIPVILITGHGDITMSVHAIKAGAVEFLPKPFRDQDLLDAIQGAIARDVARRDGEGRIAALRARYETLSPRERQVMSMLMTGQLNKQIGAAIGASESTVKAHRMQVMRKMEASSLVELIRMADSLGVGALTEEGDCPYIGCMTGLPLSLDDIRAAAAAIEGAVMRTPMRHSRTLSQIAGAEIFLKFENRQFTASFKERGALNRLLQLAADERRRGVVAMSAGNHAQGVAYHAGRLGIPATIVMPVTTPFTKIKYTRDFGATVLVEGRDLNEATVVARRLEAEQLLTFVHPFDDPRVIAGQGTVGLEMVEEFPDLDALIVPVGGGGLISGIAVAARALKPGIEIYGVQSELYPAMREILHGRPLPAPGLVQTVAEGIAVKSPGVLTTQIVRALVGDILIAREADIEHALAMILEVEKTLVEGAASAALAALLAEPARFAGRKVGLVMSGGNIDMRLLSNLILRELAREGRILSLAVELEDRPGQLALVADMVGAAGGNILEVNHNRMMTGTPLKSASLSLVIEARDAEHAAEIRQKLVEASFKLA